MGVPMRYFALTTLYFFSGVSSSSLELSHVVRREDIVPNLFWKAKSCYRRTQVCCYRYKKCGHRCRTGYCSQKSMCTHTKFGKCFRWRSVNTCSTVCFDKMCVRFECVPLKIQRGLLYEQPRIHTQVFYPDGREPPKPPKPTTLSRNPRPGNRPVKPSRRPRPRAVMPNPRPRPRPRLRPRRARPSRRPRNPPGPNRPPRPPRNTKLPRARPLRVDPPRRDAPRFPFPPPPQYPGLQFPEPPRLPAPPRLPGFHGPLTIPGGGDPSRRPPGRPRSRPARSKTPPRKNSKTPRQLPPRRGGKQQNP